MKFKVLVQNSAGDKKWEVPIPNWSFTEELNKDRSATFDIDEQVVKAVADIYNQTVPFIFYSEYREIYIFDESNNRIYGGYVAEPNVYCDANGYKKRTITSKGFFSLLEKRLTNVPTDTKRVYTAQHASDIAWDLINYTQGLSYGNLGITRGADPVDVANDRTYRYETIKRAIEKLSNNETKDGIDFEITAQKVFNAYYPEKGSQRAEIALVEGFNIFTYNIRTNFIEAMANQVVVFGEGQGDTMAVSKRDADNSYKASFFLLQQGLSEKDTETQTNLDRKGDKYLELYRAPRADITITCDYEEPLFTNYNLGDRLKLVIPSESINGYYRLYRRTLNEQGDVTLTFLTQ